jgi:hypothetical protein
MLIFGLLLQVAAPAVSARHSILAPVANQTCVRDAAGDDVVVCADPLPEQALPLPAEAMSTRPVPINRDMTGLAALNAERKPCATITGGCQVGLDMFGTGTALVRGVQKLIAPGSCCERTAEATSPVTLIGDILGGAEKNGRHTPDKTKRVAIDMEEPVIAGRMHP